MIILDMRYIAHKKEYERNHHGDNNPLGIFFGINKKLKRDEETMEHGVCVFYSLDAITARFPDIDISAHEFELDEELETMSADVENDVYDSDGLLDIFHSNEYVFGDIAASLIAAHPEENHVLVTSKIRALQLLSDKVFLFTNGKFYGINDAHNEYGITEFRDFRVMTGDRKFLPGIKGIGEKGAITLLQQYKSLYGICANVAKLPARYAKIFADLMPATFHQIIFDGNYHIDVPLVEDTTTELEKTAEIFRNAIDLGAGESVLSFDLETTGADIAKDRIVQLHAVLIYPDRTESIEYLINPDIPIAARATDVHGITDDMVSDAPTFPDVALEVLEFFERGTYWMGYNSNSFDIQILMRELDQAKKWGAFNNTEKNYQDVVEQAKLIDVIRLERHINSHKLECVYKRYYGRPLDDAHDAGADNLGTIKVLAAQVKSSQLLSSALSELSELSRGNSVDVAGKLELDPFSNEIVFAFGPKRGEPVKDYPGLVKWMEEKGFPRDTVRIAKECCKGRT